MQQPPRQTPTNAAANLGGPRRAARRVVGWLASLAATCVANFVIGALPGAGGLTDELRWRLRCADDRPQALNSVVELLFRFRSPDTDAAAQLLVDLLCDADVRVQRNAVRVAVPLLMTFERTYATQEVLRRWVACSAVDARIASLPWSYVAWCAVRDSPLAGGEPLEFDEARFVCATLHRQSHDFGSSLSGARLRFAPLSDFVGEALHARMLALGGLASYDDVLFVTAQSMPIDGLVAELVFDPAWLPRLSEDRNPEVRAGALLLRVAAGDAAALPRWAATQPNPLPRLGPDGRRLLSQLYGENWPDLLKSGTKQGP